MSGIDSDLIRGHIDTIILKTLFDGDKYGYEILDEVAKKSEGAYELKQPTLYSCLKRLEGQGLISSYWVDSEIGGKRHYYCLTDAGKDTYIENQKNWLKSRQIIDNLIWENAPAMPQKEVVVEKQPENEISDSPAPSVIDNVPDENTLISKEVISTNQELSSTQEEITVVNENTNVSSIQEEHEEKTEEALNEEINLDEKIVEIESSSKNDEFEGNENFDIMALLGHYDNSKIDEEINKLNDVNENLETINNEHSSSNDFLENFVKNYMSSDEVKPSIDINNTQEEVIDDFNLDMSQYMNDDDSYFSNTETKDKVNFITPNVVIDDLQKRVEEEYSASHIEFIDEDEIYGNSATQDTSKNLKTEELKTEEESITPTYLSFGEKIEKKNEETTYDYSSVDDTLYSESLYNSDNQSFESSEDLDSLYSASDYANYSYNNDEQNNKSLESVNYNDSYQTPEETEPQQQTEQSYSQETNTEEYYQTTYQDYHSQEIVQPKFTDDESKRKLAKLSIFAKESSINEEVQEEEKYFNADEFLARNKVVKNYDKLISDFEKEGLSVRVHSKLVKENRDSRSYVQTNKLKMTRNWISFCFIAMILAITFAVMHESGVNYYGFSYKYFIIGLTVAMIVPIISTIIYTLNPYKKNVASFSPALSFMLSMLVFVQLLLIVYCVNLQLGFYSFTQEYYNHLYWIIPTILTLYPILNSIVHTSLFKSKNFHS